MALTRAQAIACISLLLGEDHCKDFRPSKRSVWVQSWLEKRAEQDAYHNLFQELLLDDAKFFKEFIRLDRLHFQFLVERLYPRLIKRDTVMRKSIKPDEQCSLFLRYIASGESFRSLEYQFRISRRTISRVISTVAKAIVQELQDVYLKTPNKVEEWLLISKKFSQCWNFPNMTGAVDGKHVILQQPRNSMCHYRNYKGTDSIIRMAVARPEFQFLFAVVGMNRRNSDRGNCFEESIRKKYFESSKIKTFT